MIFRRRIENDSFTWLVTEEIISEYKVVLARLGVLRHIIGTLINRLREEAEVVEVRRPAYLSPDSADDPVCNCAGEGHADFLITLKPRDFPQARLTAKVIAFGRRHADHAARRPRSI